MDQDAPARDTQIVMTQQSPSFIFSDEQFERFLTSVHQRRQDLVKSLHTLTPEQQRASELFGDLATGIGVEGFGAQLAPLVRHGNTIQINIPYGAVLARVYSEAGVADIRLEDYGEGLDLNGRVPPTARVGRIEFFDARNVLLEVTGAEPVSSPNGRLGARL